MSHPLTIQFSDDQSGKNANKEVQANGHVHQLQNFLEDTPLAADGFVSSVQLLQNRTGVTVVVKNNNQELKTVNGDNNYGQFPRTSIQHMSFAATKQQ